MSSLGGVSSDAPPSTISPTKKGNTLQKFLTQAKRFFISVIKWIAGAITAFQESLSEDNIRTAQNIVNQSLVVLSRQFWGFA